MSLICKLCFVRHGAPLNRDKLIGGRTDVPLTEEGEKQALAAAPLLSSWTWVVGVHSSAPATRSNWRCRAYPMRFMMACVNATGAYWKIAPSELPPYESTPPWEKAGKPSVPG
jgi:probable phosphoglycerate mutase